MITQHVLMFVFAAAIGLFAGPWVVIFFQDTRVLVGVMVAICLAIMIGTTTLELVFGTQGAYFILPQVCVWLAAFVPASAVALYYAH